VNFISLEDDLFCLSLGNKESISYFALNNPQAKVWRQALVNAKRYIFFVN
jgi:hypothetical protein